MKSLFFLLILLTSPSKIIASEKNMIVCKIERKDFKQACYIDEQKQMLSLVIPSFKELSGIQRISLEKIFENTFIVLNPSSEEKTIFLKGLEPRIKFSVDWSWHDEACRRSQLWTDEIVMQSPVGNLLSLRIVQGTSQDYEIFLDQLSPAEKNKFIRHLDSERLEFYAELSLANIHRQKNLPKYSLARIPASCQVQIKDLRIAFDIDCIQADLNMLQAYSSELKNLLDELHKNFESHQRRKYETLCSVYENAQILKDSQGVDFEDLTLSSQNSIVSQLQKALDIHAILSDEVKSKSGMKDLWSYFIEKSTQTQLRNFCEIPYKCLGPIVKEMLEHKEHISDKQSYDLIVKYLNAKLRQRQITEAAWALVVASSYADSSQIQANWLLDEIQGQ